MPEYRLDDSVYLTILLHAAKYPSCTVDGVLLGTAAGNGKGYHITAAIPLFHQSMLMSSCVETAFTQVRLVHSGRRTFGCSS